MEDLTNITSGTAQTSTPSGAGTSSTDDAIDSRLKRFVGENGQVDSTKLAPAYLELESVVGKQSQKLATLEKAYSALANRLEAAAAQQMSARTTSPDEEFEALMQEPSGFVRKTIDAEIRPVATAIQMALLEIEHPELKDAKFKEGLAQFAASLPAGLKQSLDDFDTARFVIRMYKEQMGMKPANTANAPLPHSESPSASTSNKVGGTVYSRSEIMRLMREKPEEYAKIADDVSKAYMEGRIKP